MSATRIQFPHLNFVPPKLPLAHIPRLADRERDRVEFPSLQICWEIWKRIPSGIRPNIALTALISLFPWVPVLSSRDLTHVGRLRPFLSRDDLEFDLVLLLQAFETVAGDRATVDKDIRPTLAPQEAVPFGVVEPLDRTRDTFHFFPFLSLSPPHSNNIVEAIEKLVILV